MKSKRRRHNKQTPFYAITEDGKVYAANRKARRAAYSQNAIVKAESKPVTQGEQNGNDNSSSV